MRERELEAAYLTNALIDAHGDDAEFGYRFLADELDRAGHVAGERRVWRLCSQQKLWSTTVRKGRRGSGNTYNRRRRQRALGKLTPVEYELAFAARAAAVAA